MYHVSAHERMINVHSSYYYYFEVHDHNADADIPSERQTDLFTYLFTPAEVIWTC